MLVNGWRLCYLKVILKLWITIDPWPIEEIIEWVQIMLNRNFDDETHVDLKVIFSLTPIGSWTLYSKVHWNGKTRQINRSSKLFKGEMEHSFT